MLSHKLRKVMAREDNGRLLGGKVKAGGAYFGGQVRRSNNWVVQRDRRLTIDWTGKRQVIEGTREWDGQDFTVVHMSVTAGFARAPLTVQFYKIIDADEASHGDALHSRYETRRINHSECHSDGCACTNQAEPLFSRLRRMEIGTHHHIAGKYLMDYAAKASFPK